MAKRILLNLDLCCGCESCSAACSYYHHDQTLLAHGEVKAAANLPFHCQHCEQPTCEAACPTGSMKRGDDGVVRRAQFLCVGCNSCVAACAFGVISPELKRYVPAKCDLCIERLEEGKLPKCVSACTSGALTLEDIADDVRDKKKVQITSRMRQTRPFRRR